MMLNNVTAGAVVALGVMAAGAAQAVTLSVVGGADTVLTGRFSLEDDAAYVALANGVGEGSTIKTFDSTKGAGEGLAVSGKSKITFTFLGSEAAFGNRFFFDGVELFLNKTNSVGDAVAVVTAGAGLLPFTFTSRVVDSIANDGTATAGMSFGLSEIFNGGTSVLAFLDDNSPDVDFDDLGIRIDVSQIPTPAAGVLFLSALAGMGLLSRRRAA